MKHKAQRLIPAHQEEYTKAITCDICQKEILERASGWGEFTTVEISKGYVYGSDYSYQVTEVHICPKCYVEKIVPLLTVVPKVDREVDS